MAAGEASTATAAAAPHPPTTSSPAVMCSGTFLPAHVGFGARGSAPFSSPRIAPSPLQANRATQSTYVSFLGATDTFSTSLAASGGALDGSVLRHSIQGVSFAGTGFSVAIPPVPTLSSNHQRGQ